MDLREAWTTLGLDPDGVFGRIASRTGRDERVRAAEEELAGARSVARRLMGLHHPDRNPGDPLASERFRRTEEALRTIERETARLRELAREADGREPRDVFIEIFKP